MKTDLVVDACIVSKQRVLLVFHAKLNEWLFPGGHIEKDETADEAVIRETKEETGLDIRLLEFGPVPKTPNIIKILPVPFHVDLHSVGDHNHNCFYYLATVENEKFTRSKESKEIRWFDRNQLKNMDMPENVKKVALFAIDRFGN